MTKNLRYLAAPALILVLWLFSAKPPALPQTGLIPEDKLAHFLVYAVLSAALGLWQNPRSWRRFPVRTAFVTAAAAALFGIIDEVNQIFLLGRTASVFDWAADLLGAVCGAGLFALYKLRFAPLIFSRQL